MAFLNRSYHYNDSYGDVRGIPPVDYVPDRRGFPGEYYQDRRELPSQNYHDRRELPSQNYQNRNPYHREDIINHPRTKVDVQDKDGDTGPKQSRSMGFVTYFAESTSFMGIPKIWAQPRKALKVMWALFFLTAAAVMIFQLVQLFNNFYQYPIKTAVKLGFEPLTFPSVTICNMNPIRLSKAKNLTCEMQKALELADEDQSTDCLASNYTLDFDSFTEYELICYDDGECYEEEVSGLDKFYIRRKRISEFLAVEESESRIDVGHDIEHMLLECTLNGKTCPASNFSHFLSKELGNCYTYDSLGIRAKKSGPDSGLSMVINLESEEFINTFKTGYGLRVVVHERGTRPFPANEGFTVSAGSETSITMKLIEINRLGEPHSACNISENFKKNFGVEYTERACREFCQTNLIIDKCKCQPDVEGTVGNTKVCESTAEWTCEDQTYSKYIVDTGKGKDVCNCGTPCKEKVYQTSISSRAWPVISHVKTLEGQACKLDPDSPKCYYTDYDFDNIDLRTSSFLKLKVYFESLNFEKVTETPFYDTERFLSDIGGTMGLWIGASVLSLAEFLEIAIELFCLCFCRNKPK